MQTRVSGAHRPERMRQATAHPGRAGAIQAIAQLRRGRSLEPVLARWDAQATDHRDRALMRAITHATVRRYFAYEALIGALLPKPGRTLPDEVYAALLCGLAQLDQEISPPYAAVSDTVSALRSLGHDRYAALVNAVLRRFQREADALRAALPDDERQRFQHPQWLIDKIKRAWPADWEDLLRNNNLPAPQVLRINRQRIARDAYQELLRAQGLHANPLPGLPDALQLEDGGEVQKMPGYAQGWFSVQDGAAQRVVELLELAPQLRVLDACAAPGGKAAHILEREPGVQLLATDIQATRVRRIEENFARLGLSCTLRVADASDPSSWAAGTCFDRILIDAPCSGTGVIRRHPEIRLLRRASDLKALTAQQDRLLDTLWPLLSPGGRMVYATCSILPEENSARIEAFLRRTPRARAVPVVAESWGRSSGAGIQLLPGEHGGDGFFYAVLADRDARA